MNWFMRIIRYFFLVKEIISKAGKVHFRRYRLLKTPWFALYIHQICESDMDDDMHDHPWNFSSLILSGAYQETYLLAPDFDKGGSRCYLSGDVIEHESGDIHKIKLLTSEVWTLVFTSGPKREWGYQLKDGTWVDHNKYREKKNTKYGVVVTAYDANPFEEWVFSNGKRFETSSWDEARDFSKECEVLNYRHLYSVKKIED